MPPLECPITEDDLNAELARIEALIEPDTDTQDVSTMERQAGGTIKHSADGQDFVIPLDKTENTLDDAAIPDAQHGLSAGQLALPYNSGGLTGVTVALWNSAKSLAYSVAPRSIISALYNSAKEGVVGFVTGVRNTDGRLGHCAMRFAITTPFSTGLDNNGSLNLIAVGTGAVPETLGPPRYEGQIAYIHFTSPAGNFSEIEVTFPAAGNVKYRGLDRKIQKSPGPNTLLTAIARAGEIWTLYGTSAGGSWHLEATFEQFSGGSWRENDDGKATIWMRPIFPANQNGVVVDFPLPIAIVNPRDLHITASDNINSGTVSIGDSVTSNPGALSNAANFGFTDLSRQHSATRVALLYRVGGNDAQLPLSDDARRVSIQIENAIIDYAALP